MKSGTTLMRALLGNHPHLFSGLETHWFAPRFQEHWSDPKAPAVATVLEFFEVEPAQYRQLAAHATSANEALARLLGFCAERAGKRRWVEKTPGNVLHLEAILRTWPAAQLIHLIRDPRDAYASWKKNRKHDVARFISDVLAIEAALGEQLGAASPSYCEVHYRDLVLEPARTMREVMAFLGEPWVPAVAENAAGRADFDKVRRVTGKESPTLDSLSRPIFKESLGQWRQLLSDEERRRIESELADYGRRTRCFHDD